MVDLSEKFGSNPEAEANGVKIPLGGDAYIIVAHIGNKAFKKHLQALTKPHRHAIANGTIDDKVYDGIFCKAIARHILVGWYGVTLNGKKLEYSTETAEQILMDPTMHAFREFVVAQSGELDNFRTQSAEAMEGNSESTSDGE